MFDHLAVRFSYQQPCTPGRLGLLCGEQGLDKIIRPANHVVAAQPVLKQPIAPDLFFHRHRQGLFQGPGGIFAVKGVDDEGLPHCLGCARHFAQNQNARLVGAGSDEFLGHEVHAVAQRRDERHVAQAVERHDFVERQVPELIDQRRPMHVTEIAHDAANRLLKFQLHRLVTVHADSRRGHGNDEDHLAMPLRVVLQEQLVARAAG